MVIVDIETVAIDDAGQYITQDVVEPPDYDAIQPGRNLKNPELIAADIEKRKQAAREAYENAVREAEEDYQHKIDRCALDADLCRIVALGWCFDNSSVVQVTTASNASEERFMLENFFRDSQRHLLVTFGGHRFDLPIVMRRALYLNVPYPELNIDRYRSPHKDLLNILTHNGVLTMRSLKFYCARFGIQVDDVLTGRDIGQLVKDGQWDDVVAHCRADVLATKALATRLGVLPAVEAVAEGAF